MIALTAQKMSKYDPAIFVLTAMRVSERYIDDFFIVRQLTTRYRDDFLIVRQMSKSYPDDF